jgi:hypothetical protein
MAFDLLKLQLLQEAVDRLKKTKIRNPCICDILRDISLSWQYGVTYPFTVADIVERKINKDVERLNYPGRTDHVFWGLLFPKNDTASRIKYLEILIEDEMSGTYFMEMNHGI